MGTCRETTVISADVPLAYVQYVYVVSAWTLLLGGGR